MKNQVYNMRESHRKTVLDDPRYRIPLPELRIAIGKKGSYDKWLSKITTYMGVKIENLEEIGYKGEKNYSIGVEDIINVCKNYNRDPKKIVTKWESKKLLQKSHSHLEKRNKNSIRIYYTPKMLRCVKSHELFMLLGIKQSYANWLKELREEGLVRRECMELMNTKYRPVEPEFQAVSIKDFYIPLQVAINIARHTDTNRAAKAKNTLLSLVVDK